LVIERHDLVRNALAKFLKRIHPQANIILEPDENGPEDRRRRPDIRAEINGVVHSIDVAIAEPASFRARSNREFPSSTTPDGAAIQAERRKVTDYAGTIHQDILVPFVLESTGRLGPAAKLFLDKTTNQNIHPRSSFLLEISSILARSMGRLCHSSRTRLMNVG